MGCWGSASRSLCGASSAVFARSKNRRPHSDKRTGRLPQQGGGVEPAIYAAPILTQAAGIDKMEGSKMTKRQKALGVTEYGYQRGIVQDEFLADFEAFKAKAATIKKGQYMGLQLATEWFGDMCPQMKLEQMQPFLFGITATMHDHFVYTNTNGLDCLTVR